LPAAFLSLKIPFSSLQAFLLVLFYPSHIKIFFIKISECASGNRGGRKSHVHNLWI
jgi:hypothetical protein